MATNLDAKMKHSVRFWLLRHLPTCQQTVAKISQGMERRLSLKERISITIHLWICAWCQWYLEHLQLIRETASATADEPRVAAQTKLSHEARERIRRNLTSQS